MEFSSARRYASQTLLTLFFCLLGGCAPKFLSSSASEDVPGLVAITSPSDYYNAVSYNSKAAYTVSGTCAVDGLTVALSVQTLGTSLGSTTCSGGAWSLSADFSSVPDGTYTLVARHSLGSGTLPRTIVRKDYCNGTLANAPFAGGTGSAGDPYRVCTRTQLEQITGAVCGAGIYVSLENDIDMSSSAWTPTCAGDFAGTLDGNHLTLDGFNFSNVSIPAGAAGLFISGVSTTTIKNIKFTNVNATRTGVNYVGVLLGRTSGGTFDYIKITGSLTGTDYVGGLVGGVVDNTGGAMTISNSTVNLTGVGVIYSGGMVGIMSGVLGGVLNISDSTAAGTQSGFRDTGGVIGGLVDSNSITLSHVSSTVDITQIGQWDTGGLVAVADWSSSLTISYSSWTGTITASFDGNAGLVGAYAGTVSISHSEAHGTINGSGDKSGGLVGEEWGGGGSLTITDSHSTVDVNSVAGSSGGLMGYVYGQISVARSYATGTVVGGTGVGGFAGYLGHLGVVSISDCYATGNVTQIDIGGSAGGFIGEDNNNNDIVRTYSTGTVSGPGILGGWVGVSTALIDSTKNFWDTDISGIGISAAGTAKTSVEMSTSTTFTGAGFDLSTVWQLPASGAPTLR